MPSSPESKALAELVTASKHLEKTLKDLVKEVSKLNQTVLSIGQLYAKTQKDIEVRAERLKPTKFFKSEE